MNALQIAVILSYAALVFAGLQAIDYAQTETINNITQQCDSKAQFFSNGVEYRCRAVGPLRGDDHE